MTAEEYRELILSFIGSLTICDHLGDVAEDTDFVLKKLGIDISWYDWSELGDALGVMGIDTLYGTSLIE